MRKRWPETQNYGKSGSGPMYSFKKFYESLHSFTHEDLIVFVVSGAPRIYFNIEEANDEIHQWNGRIVRNITDTESSDGAGDGIELESEYDKWIKINKDKARFAVETFRDETVYGNWKYESLLYTASRIQKCKIFIWHTCMEESYIKTSLNDDNFYVHNESLGEACSNEYVEEERRGDKKEEWRKERREAFDLNHRVNHLTEMNHEVMYKQITGFVDDTEIPKFLKNVHKGLYEEQEFIYD
ncbi:uncharacterized protein METZ01_LOCUS231118 [marine metagenome]|uniref:Uncharacterized protein n=1 Tax=marine metagenome TaxID=408172 RepID=A0A382GTT9_9ZZZZ